MNTSRVNDLRIKMIQILRVPHSGASTCHVFSEKYYDRTYVCSRCMQNRSFVRNQSDSSVFRPAVYKKIVKAKRTNKKLKATELLKVTKTQTTQTVMTIGKLNASDVAAFVEEPGMILKNIKKGKSPAINRVPDLFASETLGKFKKKFSDDKTNLKILNYRLSDIPNVGNTHVNRFKENDIHLSSQSIGINDREKVIIQEPSGQIFSERNQEVDMFEKNAEKNLNEFESNTLDIGSNIPEYLDERESSFQEKFNKKQSTRDSKKSQDMLNYHVGKFLNSDSSIHAYIDVCIHCGLLDHAFNLLTKNSPKNIKDAEIYETLLRSLAERGDWERTLAIVTKMEKCNVPLTPQTFALFLVSAAQSGLLNEMERIALIFDKFKNYGFELNDLFTKTNLKIEERENVLKQIRKILPKFDIAPSTVNLNSNCPLVENLYKDQQRLKSPAPFITTHFLSKAVEEQLTLEDENICHIKKIGKENFSEKYDKIWSNLKEMWLNKFRENFDFALKALKTEFEKNKSKNHIYPYMLTSPEESFVKLASEEIDDLVQVSPNFSEATYILYERLGNKVFQMYHKKKITANEKLKERMIKQIEIFCRWYANPVGPARNARQKWQMLMGDNPDLAFMPNQNMVWVKSVKTNIGKYLYNIIFKSAIIPGEKSKCRMDVPAFYLVLRQKREKVIEEVKIHPTLISIVEKANSTIRFPTSQLPMLCPPKPWSSTSGGGYYFLNIDLIRSNYENYNQNYLKTVPNENLYAVFDSLNKLQSVPWRINEKVLDVAIEVFNKGGSQELDIPVKPDSTPLPKIDQNMDLEAKLKAHKIRSDILKERHDQHCLWCEGLYKLSLANHFRNKVFWLPQNLDFRGRVYPVPPHVSHVSADLYRSLLLFAKKERLGKKGFDWLKIHIINLTGTHKKKNIRERLDYANQVLPDIVDSAENPLNGKRWWTESEDPWQTLAACFEINEVLKCKDPELFESGFPVHQDGSCNGLQHYAALGRDKFGAISVNLSPSESPQDVYSDVANLIEAERVKDEAAGLEIAKLLKGFVTRKVVKRPVMTTVYGVTWYGAKLQIAGVLADIPDFPRNIIVPASSYLATKIFISLRKLFTSAREIQDWFNECSDVITRNCHNSICWENPLGLPIIQPYFKQKKRNLLKPDTKKQKNAFAPNFIHSLDSAHMMLTALNCDPYGITFASVHDCFWTHAASVDTMNKICRQSFVSLHSLDILDTLSNNFTRHYGVNQNSEISKIFNHIPKLGDFDLKTVNDSLYFFA